MTVVSISQNLTCGERVWLARLGDSVRAKENNFWKQGLSHLSTECSMYIMGFGDVLL